MRRALLLLTAMALMVVGYAGAALADTTFTVDRTDDVATATACTETTDDDCSLRGAVIAANNTSGADTITVPAGTYTLTIAGDGTSDFFSRDGSPTTGDLDITDDLTINGAGAASTTIETNTGSDDRVFHNQGAATISGVTISGARLGFDEHLDDGGGILNLYGALTVSESTITDNEAGDGGGIFNIAGTLKVERSTISGNTAQRGGGVFSSTNVGAPDKTTITNSTISGKSATDRGGGVYNNRDLTEIENSTITKNTAPNGQGSGVASYGDVQPESLSLTHTEVSSSIIAANTNTDVDFTEPTFGVTPTNSFISEGYNLIGDGNATAAFNQSTDQANVSDPKLGALANNGGSTLTHRLKPTSPAINAIPSATNGCGTTIATDQTGTKRPQGAGCDIGSYENKSPKVKGVSPKNGATGIGVNAKVRAYFSQGIRRATINEQSFRLFKDEGTSLTPMGAQVSYDALKKVAILDPHAPLEAGATYRAVVHTAVKDLAGNQLDQDRDPANGNQPKEWSFTVGT